MNTIASKASTADILRNLSVQDFKEFGTDFVAYVRPVTVENRSAFGLYGADGSLLSLQETGDKAILLARDNGLEPVVVH